MKSIRIVVVLTVLGVFTLASGVLNGRLSNRWGPSSQAQSAASELVKFPQRFGDWQMTQSKDLSAKIQDMLQCSGYFDRAYTNQQTGQTIRVALLLGPPGPMTVHRPEICYSSRTYAILESAKKVDVAGHEFWTLTFKSKKLDGELLRVYYGWTTDAETPWTAAGDWARLYYAAKPCLYKVQLSGIPLNDSDDPVRSFLEAFLPAVKPHLATF